MRQELKYAIVYSGLIVLLLCGCKGKNGQEILSPETMKLVVWDMLRADEMAMSDNSKDTVRTHFLQHSVHAYEQVFAIHHITKEQFYRSYKYYQERPDENKALLDSVLAFGNRIKAVQDSKDSVQRVAQLKLDSARLKLDSARMKADTAKVKQDSLKKALADTLAAVAKRNAVKTKLDSMRKIMPSPAMKKPMLALPKLRRDSLIKTKLRLKPVQNALQ